MRRLILSIVLGVLLTGAWSEVAKAATHYWDGNGTGTVGGGSGVWDTSLARWSASPDGSSYLPWNNDNIDSAVFPNTAGTVTIGTPVTVQNITFGVATYVLSGTNPITLAGENPTITTLGGMATISAPLAGSAGLIKASGNNNTLVLSGTNSYTGPTVINGGTLRAQSNGALGNSSDVTVANGASLGLQEGVTITGKALTLTGNGFDFPYYYGNRPSGALRNSGGNNVWAGNVIVSGGEAYNRIVVDYGSLTISGNVTLSGTYDTDTNGAQLLITSNTEETTNLTITGNITGGIADTVALYKSQVLNNSTAGTLTLSGVNTYLGHTYIGHGRLVASGGSAIPDTSYVYFTKPLPQAAGILELATTKPSARSEASIRPVAKLSSTPTR